MSNTYYHIFFARLFYGSTGATLARGHNKNITVKLNENFEDLLPGFYF